ncbi:hypothetical protein A3C87_03870 [Candidatus Kaiserbacteria bacterium RIFCSPHIGHO2_02_FULL_49_34]|uniref:Uncharacterized protein n=1 Tax=Candidatus Kaiserbacteria bacterium RIFCSPHIGHO2_02_FULL_49_34 TaxID=1798491 RepID=A0A1F6DJW6_9BACT|nr:MAG: hypothetical protein A3C87_03870 [Candidatus Kaiserbacteria bacterium RIFCSPHIGHO2_02_FULL_49_34]
MPGINLEAYCGTIDGNFPSNYLVTTEGSGEMMSYLPGVGLEEYLEDVIAGKYSAFELLTLISADMNMHLRVDVLPELHAGNNVRSLRGDVDMFLHLYGMGCTDLVSDAFDLRKKQIKAGLPSPHAYLIYNLDPQMVYDAVRADAKEGDSDTPSLEYFERMSTGLKHFKASVELDGTTKVYIIDANGSDEDICAETNEIMSEIIGQ